LPLAEHSPKSDEEYAAQKMLEEVARMKTVEAVLTMYSEDVVGVGKL